MNRGLFLKQLRLNLRGLPDSEIEEIINDYDDYFKEAEESGVSEEEAARNLGNPNDIAKEIRLQQNTKQKDSNVSQQRNIAVMIGLILFNLFIVLGPVLGVIGAFFGIVFAAGVFITTPVLVIGSMMFSNGHLFEFFLSLIFAGIGLLLFPFLIKVARAGVKLINRYIEWNVKLTKGEI